MSLLEIDNLRAGYGVGEVLHGVTLSVEEGEVVVVLGANGAGKTTLMRAITGLIDRQGRIDIGGTATIAMAPTQVVGSGISLVPQGRGTFSDLTIEENLLVGASRRRDRAAIRADVGRWFEVFPILGQRRNSQAGTLSGGEQQMLAVARALMARPRMLLCDEPSLGLAPMIITEVFSILRRLNEEDGTSMLVVEQNADMALNLAARAYVMEAGTVVKSGSSEELRRSDDIRRAYLGS